MNESSSLIIAETIINVNSIMFSDNAFFLPVYIYRVVNIIYQVNLLIWFRLILKENKLMLLAEGAKTAWYSWTGKLGWDASVIRWCHKRYSKMQLGQEIHSRDWKG